MSNQCPRYHQKPTRISATSMSAKCQYQTSQHLTRQRHLLPHQHAIHAHRLEFWEIEPEVLHDERAKGFAIRQMSRLGHAIADDVDALVHDVDAPFLGNSTSEDVVGEEGIWVSRYVVIHHLEI